MWVCFDYVHACAVMPTAGASLGFVLASGVLAMGGGQRGSSSKVAQPSALHTGTNTPLNQGLHILL